MTQNGRPTPPAGFTPAPPEAAPAPQTLPQQPPAAAKRLEGFLAQLACGARRFPATIVLAAVYALGFSLLWQSVRGDVSEDLITDLIVAGSVGAALSIPVRLFFERSKTGNRPVIAAIIPLAVSALTALARHAACSWDKEPLFYLICAGLGIFAVASMLFLLSSEDGREGIFPHLICSSILASFVSSILQGGLMVCLSAFSFLIRELDMEFLMSVTGFASTVVFALVFCSQLPRTGDTPDAPRPYRIIAGYIVLPLCLLLLAVLYAYILRIFVAHEMPSGTMNWFGSIALMVEIALWLGLQSIDNKPARLFVRWGWALMLPVTAVQIYGVYLRVSAYGLTALRAGGLVCLLVGLCALLIQALSRRPRAFYAVVAVAALVFTASPANVFDIAYLSQSSRFSTALAQLADGAGDEAKRRLTSSWDYLTHAQSGYFSSPEVETYLERWTDGPFQDSFEKLFGFAPVFEETDDAPSELAPASSYREFANTGRVDVEGFSSFYAFDSATDAEGSYVVVISEPEGGSFDFDASALIAELESRGDGKDEVVDLTGTGVLVIDLDDGSRIVLTNVTIFYENDVIDTVYLSGYVLVP